MDEQINLVQKVILWIILMISFILLCLAGLVVLSSCTLNVIMTHTEGEASDVVDSDPKNEATPHVQLSIPSIPL